MSSPNETEIKFKVADLEALATRLDELGFKQITPSTHEINTLFDLPARQLTNRGDLLRLRKYGETWVLTYKTKGNSQSGQHKVRIETETQVEDGIKMEAILRSLQFEPSFRYEKFRSEWQGEQGHVVVDETPIGNFAEIEGPGDWIDRVAQDLGISPAKYITDSYAGLFLDWKHRTGSPADEMTFMATGHKPPQ